MYLSSLLTRSTLVPIGVQTTYWHSWVDVQNISNIIWGYGLCTHFCKELVCLPWKEISFQEVFFFSHLTLLCHLVKNQAVTDFSHHLKAKYQFLLKLNTTTSSIRLDHGGSWVQIPSGTRIFFFRVLLKLISCYLYFWLKIYLGKWQEHCLHW